MSYALKKSIKEIHERLNGSDHNTEYGDNKNETEKTLQKMVTEKEVFI